MQVTMARRFAGGRPRPPRSNEATKRSFSERKSGLFMRRPVSGSHAAPRAARPELLDDLAAGAAHDVRERRRDERGVVEVAEPGMKSGMRSIGEASRRSRAGRGARTSSEPKARSRTPFWCGLLRRVRMWISSGPPLDEGGEADRLEAGPVVGHDRDRPDLARRGVGEQLGERPAGQPFALGERLLDGLDRVAVVRRWSRRASRARASTSSRRRRRSARCRRGGSRTR